MSTLELEKRNAAIQAVAEIRAGMLVGLGTGSTASYAVRQLGRRIAVEGLRVTATATSQATETLALSHGILLRPMGELSFVDIAIDGADQIDPEWRMIKGGGGALFREKIVAAAARQMIIVADSSKLAPALGHRPLPVEVHPFAFASVQQTLAKLDYPTALRKTPNRAPFITEQNALILDLRIGLIEQPEELAVRLDAIPGILAHGLFIGAADRVIIGTSRTGGTRDHS